MRKLSSVCVFFFTLTAFSQTQVIPNASKNYIHSITYKTGSTEAGLDTVSPNNKIENISYFDGLGRPVQSVAVRQGGKDGLAAEADLYTHIEYDAYGRETKKYLPLPSAQNDGRFITDPVTAITNYYTANYAADLTGTINPYSEARFEASPLNRVMEQGAPGTAWAVGTGHTIKFDYQTNTAGEVLRYDVSLTADYTPALTQPPSPNNVYLPGTLYKTVTKDENWQPAQTYLKDHTTEEFKDLQGRVVLKRTYNTNLPHDTYYVYDDYGNLTYVLPPKVVTSDGVSATELAELCYQYKYDGRNRLVEKKIPGKGKEHIVYNKLDQPILTQDANLQTQSKWLFTKYDAFGRVVYTGLISSASDRLAQQAAADAAAVLFESRTAAQTLNGTTVYYTNNAYPDVSIGELHTINYYDDYAFDLGGLAAPPVSVYSQTLLTGAQLKGLPTGSKVRTLGTANWTTTLTGYDPHKRPVWTASKNTYLGTTDFVETKLNFIGWAEEVKNIHQKTGQTDLVVVEKFTYDHAGKVLTQTHQVNSNPAQRIADNTYDQLGQLKKKNVGGTTLQAALQNVDYAYNIRGWLKTINDVNNIGTVDLFAFSIAYNDPQQGGTPQYIENVSETEWVTVNDNVTRWYSYSYDALNRLKDAVSYNGNYDVSLAYDKMGNITRLTRDGHRDVSATTFGLMDDLTYQYSGNLLTSIDDAPTASSVTGFIDGAETTDEYEFDANGNMVRDDNKGITDIGYNHLNMPTEITVTGSNAGILDYVYAADGTKLQKKKTQGSVTTTTDYAGNFVYEGGSLKQITHPEGYIEPDGGSWQYVYRLTDIWENTRVTFADDNGDGDIDPLNEIRREQNYYPGGLEHKGYNSVLNGVKNNLKTYQKQEFTEDLGLGFHEWHYRASYPDIIRFWQIDPLSEKYVYNSTHAFQENKLGMGVELEGLENASYSYNGRQQAVITENQNNITEEDRKASTEVSLIAVSLVVPGPEDVVLAGIAASKIGVAVVKGLSKLFGKSASKADDVTEIIIDANKHPESAQHLDEAIKAGKSNEGVVDRAGAANRRKENLKGTKTQKGKDRDEAPPAVINTGEKASVKTIGRADNRGAGGSIGRQLEKVKDGKKVKIVPKNLEKQ